MSKVHLVSIEALVIPVLLIFSRSPAPAGSLPPAQFQASGEGLVGFQTTTDPGTFSASNCFLGDCQTTMWSLSYASGSASTSMSGTDTGPGNAAGGIATTTFYFGVVGNYSGVVPVVVTATANTSASSPGSSSSGVKEYAQAYADVSAFNPVDTSVDGGFEGGLAACTASGAPAQCSGLPSSFTNSTIKFDISPNEFGANASYVELLASTSTNGGSFSVSVDPMVTFAPGVDSTGLSLEFSPNPPVSATPEPASLLLLGTGLLALAWMIRRRPAVRG